MTATISKKGHSTQTVSEAKITRQKFHNNTVSTYVKENHSNSTSKSTIHHPKLRTTHTSRLESIPKKISNGGLLSSLHFFLGFLLGSLYFTFVELRLTGSIFFPQWQRRRQLVELTVTNLAFAVFCAMLQEVAIIVVVGVVVQPRPI